MKKIYAMFLLLAPAGLFAQAQVENGDFEGAWENVAGAEDEPEEWSSLKTADALTTLAPVVAFQGSGADCHGGTGCIKLVNISSIVVANGLLTNGRVHADLDPENGYVFTEASDPQWNTPFTDKPDSLVAWIKYLPQGSDTCKLEIVLHEDTAPGINPHDGTFDHWAATARYTSGATFSEWTRISTPFNYYTAADPDYLLMVISAGDSTSPVANSELWVDDIELIYNPIDTGGTGAGISEDQLTYSIVVHDNFVRVTVDDLENAAVQVMSLDGKVVYEEKLTQYISEIPMNVPAGIYVYNVRFGKHERRGKIKL